MRGLPSNKKPKQTTLDAFLAFRCVPHTENKENVPAAVSQEKFHGTKPIAGKKNANHSPEKRKSRRKRNENREASADHDTSGDTSAQTAELVAHDGGTAVVPVAHMDQPFNDRFQSDAHKASKGRATAASVRHEAHDHGAERQPGSAPPCAPAVDTNVQLQEPSSGDPEGPRLSGCREVPGEPTESPCTKNDHQQQQQEQPASKGGELALVSCSEKQGTSIIEQGVVGTELPGMHSTPGDPAAAVSDDAPAVHIQQDAVAHEDLQGTGSLGERGSRSGDDDEGDDDGSGNEGGPDAPNQYELEVRFGAREP